jgi:translocator protein
MRCSPGSVRAQFAQESLARPEHLSASTEGICLVPTSSVSTAGWKKWVALAILLALVFAVSALGSFVTIPKVPGWYANLTKPFFNPPPWIFAPVWTILYVLMAFAAWLVWLQPPSSARRVALFWFAVQLFLNAAWSPIFFGLESPRIALAVVSALLLSLMISVVLFFRVSRRAGWMMMPYLAWVVFASALNTAIVVLN